MDSTPGTNSFMPKVLPTRYGRLDFPQLVKELELQDLKISAANSALL